MDLKTSSIGGECGKLITTDATETSAVKIKKEPSSSDEMKEYAETAMNELLGWYGYEVGSDQRPRAHSAGDSSGPEYSDSGGGGGGPGWCGWCSRPMAAGAPSTGAFCSELCFSQSRRASFKRNRTCDWCRSVRHSVAHVDVRDGARHLQFCGDKCLNQYKMHIFCRETRAHLELHPHPSALAVGDAPLITPDLWLRDCRDDTPPPPGTTRHSPPPTADTRRRHKRPAIRRNRTATVTSQPEESMDAPQDLRVRPRSPDDSTSEKPIILPSSTIRTHPIIPSHIKHPSVPSHSHASVWPPPPPPVTVLVPYPVVIPIPLPLPIPIPVPSDILQRISRAEAKEEPPSAVPPTPAPDPEENDVRPTRTLRKRRRPASGGGAGDPQTPRRTVPA